MIFCLSLTTSHMQWVRGSGAVIPSLFREQPVSMANSTRKRYGCFSSFFGRFGSFLFCWISRSFLVIVWYNLPGKRAYHKGFPDSFSPRLKEQAKKNPQRLFDRVCEIPHVLRSGHRRAYILGGAKLNRRVLANVLPW